MHRWEDEGEECVYVCCVDWKRKRKGEQEWEWRAKERKEGIVRYVVGEDGLGGVVGRHVGTKKYLPPPPLFFWVWLGCYIYSPSGFCLGYPSVLISLNIIWHFYLSILLFKIKSVVTIPPCTLSLMVKLQVLSSCEVESKDWGSCL